MGLFSGMESLGLGGFTDAKVIENKKESEKTVVAIVEKKEEDMIFDKHFTCPVCDMTFVSKCVRSGKNKLVSKDTDLRPRYESMDPLKYDVVACDTCGYAALLRYFSSLSTTQRKNIKEKVSSSFRGLPSVQGKYSYDDSIIRYKLALICSMVKNAKNSEKGYTCLKMLWVIRGKIEETPKESPEYKSLCSDELECISNAYECFNIAVSTENYPIAGMDESTLLYIMSDLARKLKKYEESAKLLGTVITSKATTPRLKDEALKLKDILKQEIKASKS